MITHQIDPTVDAPPFEDDDQPYDRIRELEDDELDPDLRPALKPQRGVCVMHRVKSQIEAGHMTTADRDALSFIRNYERLIDQGERPPCACRRRTKRGGKGA